MYTYFYGQDQFDLWMKTFCKQFNCWSTYKLQLLTYKCSYMIFYWYEMFIILAAQTTRSERSWQSKKLNTEAVQFSSTSSRVFEISDFFLQNRKNISSYYDFYFYINFTFYYRVVILQVKWICWDYLWN